MRVRLTRWLLALPRERKRVLMVLADSLLLPFAFWCAVALRYGTVMPKVAGFWWLFPLIPLLSVPVFVRLGLYRAVIRYLEEKVMFTVVKGVTVSSILVLTVIGASRVEGVPRTSVVIYWGLAVLYLIASRFSARSVVRSLDYASGSPRRRVAIYGAGETGRAVAVFLRNSPDFLPLAFFDDSRVVRRQDVAGLRVYNPERMTEVLEDLGVREVLLAMPRISQQRRAELVGRLSAVGVEIKTVPCLNDLVSGRLSVSQIREIRIEDLLGRNSVEPVQELLARGVRDKVVLVTGGGGSIGSELARQILLSGPRRLILLDASEFALYSIHQELEMLAARRGSDTELVPVLGNVCDRQRIEAVVRGEGVQTLFHAAAYKHVPLVEANPVEGIRTNVFGTWVCADVAKSAGVERFVLISTDKAVRPTNVMGASKRCAELVLQAYAARTNQTRFAMVRFGNVLGSSGSVVPLFRRQIAEGGPVTVTHPEMTRYFMTIPEAAQLVIQAGAMAAGGEVFVLDMGEPVKIMDLARGMIRLAGLTVRDDDHPDGDIEIRITGLRPGEKLYEELLIGASTEGTMHPLICLAREQYFAWSELESQLLLLQRYCDAGDVPAIRAVLSHLVVGYQPAGESGSEAWRRAMALPMVVEGVESLH